MGAFELVAAVAFALVTDPMGGLSIRPFNRAATFRNRNDLVHLEAHRVTGRKSVVDGFTAQGAGGTIRFVARPDCSTRSPVTVTGVSYLLQQDSG